VGVLGLLGEEVALFYFAEAATAVACLHGLGFLHRSVCVCVCVCVRVQWGLTGWRFVETSSRKTF
jgi:hypothetical protein